MFLHWLHFHLIYSYPCFGSYYSLFLPVCSPPLPLLLFFIVLILLVIVRASLRVIISSVAASPHLPLLILAVLSFSWSSSLIQLGGLSLCFHPTPHAPPPPLRRDGGRKHFMCWNTASLAQCELMQHTLVWGVSISVGVEEISHSWGWLSLLHVFLLTFALWLHLLLFVNNCLHRHRWCGGLC